MQARGEAAKRLKLYVGKRGSRETADNFFRQEGKPGCKAVIKISNVDAAVRYETPCGHVKERQGCKAVIKISNADATVRYETPCGRVKIVQETNKSENK